MTTDEDWRAVAHRLRDIADDLPTRQYIIATRLADMMLDGVPSNHDADSKVGAVLGAIILAAGSGLLVSAILAATIWLWRTAL